ncbi:sulfatase [Phragmitibacter flavus]|uniref:Sulfatase n=1 Tax=Phragmitibacter flavus TaxID=2576071 RepID=A0A5R8KBD8_9BACT|nr:sulfatase [Phragmitibacter flavus]TLD69622.1 sulfatase [Phragmitibacter flavus]
MLRLLPFLFFILLISPLHAAEKNIVFYIADDLGTELGCYGNKVIQTPHIDALAADGTVFTNAYATTASCSASRSVIMTGLHNHANGHYGHAHDTGHFSCYPNTISLALPQVIKRAGYRTALIGKHHVSPNNIFQYDLQLGAKGRNSVATVEQAREFILAKDEAEADKQKPFLLYVGQIDPHRSNDDLEIPNKPNAFGNLPNQKSFPDIKETFYDPKDVIVPPFLPDTPETRAELAQYYQSVSRFDAGLGHLIQILKEANLYDKTLIIVTSDHGMAFPGAKTTVSEPGLRVPFIVRNPYNAKRGVRNTALVSHTDITPSLLDFAGGLDHEKNAPKNPIDPVEHWNAQNLSKSDNRGPKYPAYHGRSWLNILDKETDPTRDLLFASHTFHEVQMYYPMRVIRDQKYKLIWNIAWQLPFPFSTDLWSSATWQAQLKKGNDAPFGHITVGQYLQRPEFELYDLEYDPHESLNLASDPDHLETLNALKQKLKTFQQTHRDPWVLKWEYQ